MVRMQTNRARGGLLYVVLVTGCVYMRATVCVCVIQKINGSTPLYEMHLYVNIKYRFIVWFWSACTTRGAVRSFVCLDAKQPSWSDVLTSAIIDLPTPAYDPQISIHESGSS